MIKKAYVVPHPPIILPEVGKGEEKRIQKTIDAMKEIAREIKEIEPETIIIISPHAPAFMDGFYMEKGEKAKGNLSNFGIFNVNEEIQLDEELTEEILSQLSDFPILYSDDYRENIDHGALIPIRFIHEFYNDFKVVLVGLSGLSEDMHFKFGEGIDRAIRKLNRKSVLIASGDLSHVLKEDGPYGFEKEGPIFDEKIVDILTKGEFDRLFSLSENLIKKASQCGLNSFQIMAGALSSYDVSSKFLSYEGPFGVGYGVFSFETMEKIDPYVNLAKLTIEEYITKGKILNVPDNLPKDMIENAAGTFVTLHKNGELRGCIGTINPTKSTIAEEIIHNAISSSTRDPRFPQVVESELEDLEISVDVLKEAEKIESISQLDVYRYGVIVSRGFRRGLLLPNIEGIDNPEMQVAIALQKAGIMPDEKFEMERFEVIRHE